MKAGNPSSRERAEAKEAALRRLVRLLARQAAAEHVRGGLQDGASRR